MCIYIYIYIYIHTHIHIYIYIYIYVYIYIYIVGRGGRRRARAHVVPPVTVKHECPQLSLLIITSDLEANKIEPRSCLIIPCYGRGFVKPPLGHVGFVWGCKFSVVHLQRGIVWMPDGGRLYIYIYICFYLPLSLSLYIYIYMYNIVYIYIYIHTHIHIYIYIYLCAAPRLTARKETIICIGSGIGFLIHWSLLILGISRYQSPNALEPADMFYHRRGDVKRRPWRYLWAGSPLHSGRFLHSRGWECAQRRLAEPNK